MAWLEVNWEFPQTELEDSRCLIVWLAHRTNGAKMDEDNHA
jgi:hypothetical protein